MSTSQSLVSARISPPDFVSGDFDALALHMQQCRQARGRWFAAAIHLQRARALVAGRIVTMGCVAVALVIGLAVIA
jgi:hypothetical protein